jgi:hypothetical protein
MTELSSDPASELDRHADKYNDPRAKITRRGILIGVGVVLLGILGAAASIYGRRTRLVQTTRFWGPEVILALQLGEKIELIPDRGREFEPVDLTGTPGLGHLRRRLLDERSFDWDTESAIPVADRQRDAEDEFAVRLRITDPSVHRFDPVTLQIDLAEGWVGRLDQAHSVRLADRKRTGVRHFLETIMNRDSNRYDLRSGS